MNPLATRSALRNRWEQRAHLYQNQLRGVLLQGLPDGLNQTIHGWHERLVTELFTTRLPPAARVVDLAAGYGRLSRCVQEQRADIRVMGADLSFTYAAYYAQTVGPALCADLAQLPYAAATWDGALLVTGLMYLDEQECAAVLHQILHTLKPGGLLFCVDPGAELTQWLRWLHPSFRQRTTGGEGFEATAYRALFIRPDCRLIASGSNSWFTLALPLLWLANRIMPTIAARVAGWVAVLDGRTRWFARLALHRWLLVQKTMD